MSDEEYSDQYYDDDDEDMLGMDDDDSAPSEMDIDLAASEIKMVAAKGKGKVYEVDFTSLNQSEVEERIRRDVDHIVGVFDVEPDIASLLLRHMNWNKEKLIEKYMDNPSSVNVAAGISESPPPTSPTSPTSARSTRSATASSTSKNPFRRQTRRTTADSAKSAASLSPSTSFSSEPFVCPICFDDSQTSSFALACEHKFCDGCWLAYLTSKIREEGEHSIRCMAEGCSLVAPDDFLKRALAEDPSTYARFQELIVRHFVASINHLKFCPYPSCTFTVSCSSAASKSALASIVPIVHCGQSEKHVFCFGCPIEDDHRPVICGVAKLWQKKCQDDSETANWIKSNTKECTKCQSTIEKNGGCNHMTCKKCKHEFCWVCMGPWSEHGTSWYSCNRYDDAASLAARDAQSKSRASLERYLHYYNRWANHEQSAKLSVDLHQKTEKKMEEMQVTSALTWIEVQFAKKAVDEVFRCRMTLKWTYAMAYYLAKNNQKELFEDNQRDLEKAVEDLSELLEQPIEPENIATLRQKMTDKTVYVQKRNEIMLEDTAQGLLDGRWSWNVPVDGFEFDEANSSI